MPEGIVVEPAAAGDLQRIIAMDPRAADTPGRREFLERAHAAGECIVARRGGEMAGFVVLDRLFFGQRFVELLYVEQAHRRAGVARAMVRHIEWLCPGEKLFTSTNESNAAMHAFCAALGFAPSGRIDNLDEGDPEIVYFKRAGVHEGDASATTGAHR
ncbi:MAG: GNAT family N-acetyltransferase [Dehalococcoidia bacterium]|nr:MAG: GNAT family N-acetyltransferase [Dehalococcoidia bacterium]